VRDGPQAADLLGLVRSADRALDEEHVERPGRPPRCRLGELDEVVRISDRIALMRDGHNIAQLDGGCPVSELTRLIASGSQQ